MFEQMDDPEVKGRKTLKEKLVEAAIIVAVSGVVIGVMLYALHAV
jgi:hypothetical protein